MLSHSTSQLLILALWDYAYRLQEVEREREELQRQWAMDKATLSALQSDLVAEKLNTQQLKVSLDKLGLPVDHLIDSDNALDR